MRDKLDVAREFFEACDSGKGWVGCQSYCHADASFAAQAPALAGVDKLETYCDWMQGIFMAMPDARSELKCIAAEDSTDSVVLIAVFSGTHNGEGGPIPATGKAVATDFAYHIIFEGERIRHLSKIWNDGFALQQLGWA